MFFSLNTCDVESPKVCFLMFPCRSRCGDRDEPSPKRIKTEVRETSLQPDYSRSFFQGHVERNRFWSPQTQLETLTHSVLVSTNTALDFPSTIFVFLTTNAAGNHPEFSLQTASFGLHKHGCRFPDFLSTNLFVSPQTRLNIPTEVSFKFTTVMALDLVASDK